MIFSLASFRLRILFRGAFLLLALATVAMALYVLLEEKQLSYRNYRHGFGKTMAEIVARLHHPSGQLALLNPQLQAEHITPLRLLLLPFASLDFDDHYKVQQAIEMSGCEVIYPPHGSICAAIGSNPWAGGFVYVTGRFAASALVPHLPGDLKVDQAHRVRVALELGEQNYRWIAPFEILHGGQSPAQKSTVGRLTGFADDGGTLVYTRPLKDFRGWVWQDPQCLPGQEQTSREQCLRGAFFSMRLPVAAWRDALFSGNKPVWPPRDLDRIRVHLEILPPGDGAALLDSDSGSAAPPFTLSSLGLLLQPGETLSIGKLPQSRPDAVIKLVGKEDQPFQGSRLLGGLIRRLPVEGFDTPIEKTEVIATPLGSYQLTLAGDVGMVNKSLSAVATRVSWFVGGMLLAIFLVWMVIELVIIRRIKVLTRRAVNVSQSVRGTGQFDQLDLTDLRSRDELGLLASGLADLLDRVREDVARERIRAEQERDMWHAVGHEIMSPLQSLMALHTGEHDESSRYIKRMQQAVRVLYGSASPSEAFQATTLREQVIDLNDFLASVADNAPCAGIPDVAYQPAASPVWVRADEYSLEDVVTHILRNADRYRLKNTPISVALEAGENRVQVSIHNQGPAIPEELIGKIFEYGVSGPQDNGGPANRGQGLFVAKTYMAKMGGTIAARNEGDGVSLVLSLERWVRAWQET